MKGCPKCGRMIDSNLNKCPHCNYDFEEIEAFFKRVKKQKFIEEGKYAGFIKRLVAGVIDFEIISGITIFIIHFLTKYYKTNIYINLAIFAIFYVLLMSIMERTKWRASIGKKIVGIEVMDEHENPMTFIALIGRNITKILNVLTLGIGFSICVAPPKRQTLADRVSKTYVLNKVDFKEEDKHSYASAGKRLVAYILDIMVIALINVTIIYAYDYIIKNVQNLPELMMKNKEIIKYILTSIASILYFPINESYRGKTVGRRLLNMRLTNLDENKISFIKSLIREILQIIDIVTLGFLLPLTHNKRQTIKDMITKTIIIDG